MHPSIGRIVHYAAPDTHGNLVTTAGIITGSRHLGTCNCMGACLVEDHYEVDLSVFHRDTLGSQPRMKVQYSGAPTLHCWSWPPRH